ncbi:MAG: glycosyltransferase family 2 protein [Thermoleophilaceae bacterium]|nr:glycosyltransferase family 2 protein [Thermoleophilaceae bacterium]
MAPEPWLSVVVPTRARFTRLRWLLNALEEQSLPADEWEVIVAHDGVPETARIVAEHPLAAAGRLHGVSLDHLAGPAAKRNLGWRAARGSTIVFTDDDCRPPPEWLDRLAASVRGRPGAVVQGATRPDPDELALTRVTPWWRSQEIAPPTLEAQTCNIAYPRDLLERLGGFDERTFSGVGGEDADLCVRAIGAGAEQVSSPATTFHAVEDMGLLGQIRVALRWTDVVAIYARHPRLRRRLILGLFWKPRHPLVLLATVGLLLSPRSRGALVLCLPYAWRVRPSRRHGLRAFAVALPTIPARGLIDLAEVVALARGSIAHRTLVL